MKPNDFHAAGTKDKRAKTSQLVSVYRTEAERLANLNSRLRGIRLGNFFYRDEDLALGDLSGNRFGIVLRSIDKPEEFVKNAVEKFIELGFVNYFGAQRFGLNANSPTHKIGR